MSAQQTAVSWVPEGPKPTTFGGRLRILRLDLGDISVSEAARRCGFPTPTWRNWEKAGTAPVDQGQVVRQIHDATGVDMAWLMWGTVPPKGGEGQAQAQSRCTVRPLRAAFHMADDVESPGLDAEAA